MLPIFLNSFVLFFITIDTIGNLPFFISLTEGAKINKKNQIAIKSVIYAFFILILFAYLGRYLLDALGVTLDSLKIAGGIIPIDEKGFSLWNPYEALNDNELHLYKVYEKHASEFLKRFNRDISTPFDAPYVFPEAYEDEDVYVIEF